MRAEGTDQADGNAPKSILADLSLGAGLVAMAIAVSARVVPHVREIGWLVVSCFIVSIAGVITGIVALVRIGKSGDKVRGFRTACAGTLLSALVALSVFGFLWGRHNREPERSPTVWCLSNLRNISLGLEMYRDAYQGELPDTLEGVYQYMPVPKLFVCPNDPEPRLIPDSFRYSERFPAGGLQCSYHYVGRLSPETDERVILMYGNAGNHVFPDKTGKLSAVRHVAFADYRSERLSEDEFQERLRESLELVKQADWDSYSPERQAEIEAFYQDRPLR